MSDSSRHGASLPARILRSLLHAAERAGGDAEAMLARHRLDPARLEDPDARFPLDAASALIEDAAGETGDELLGLHAAQHRALADFSSFAFLLTTSGTLGEALDECATFERLMGESFRIARSEGLVMLRYQRQGSARPAQRHLIEMISYDWAVNLGRALRLPVRAQRVRLKHQPPAWGATALEAAFECPVELCAPLDEIVFPAEAMSLPMPDANADLHAFFVRHEQERLARLPAPDDLLSRARALVEARLTRVPGGLDAVAKDLAVGARTLQRRLQEAGHTMRSLVDDVRKERAFALLEARVAIPEIAERAGYSEPAAFYRAFKRWTGTTPQAFRESMEQASAGGAP